MNKVFVYIAAASAIGLLGVQFEARGAGTRIPYSDDFDGYNMGLFTGSTYWTTNGTGSALITNNPAPAVGILMCNANDMNLTLTVDQSRNYTNVIWSFLTQPVRYEDEGGTAPPTNFSGAAAAFYVDTNGVVKAYRFIGGSNDWTSISAAGAVPTNQWVGFSVRIQYAPSASNYYVSVTTNGVTIEYGPLTIPSNAPTKLCDVAVYNSYNLDLVSLSFPPTPPGSVGLPFFDGFENYFTSGTRMGPLTNDPTAKVYWSLSGGDDASAIVTNAPTAIEPSPIASSRQCHMTNANLTLNVDAGKCYSNIWCQMYIRPVGYEDDGGASAPSVAAGAAAAVYVDTNGYLKAYAFVGTSNAWSNLVYVSTSTWVGVAMHVDYIGRKWEVFYTTNGYGSPMTNASSNALDIQTNAASVTTIGQVVIQNNADLDAVGVSQGYTPVTNQAGVPRARMVAMTLAGGRTNLLGILAHHYGAADDTLTGPLGADLMAGFADGDKVAFFYTNGWNQYRVSGDSWVRAALDSLAPGLVHITPGMGMRVMMSNPTNTVVFYPHDSASNVSTIIYGTNWTGMGGWNLLSWPFYVGQAASSGWGFNGWATNGDKIYMYTDGHYDAKLWWSPPTGTPPNRWMQGPSASSYTIRTGQAFWYYRSVTGSNMWSAANPSP